MSFQDFQDEQKQVASDFFVPNVEKIELLQSILRTQYKREVTFEEAEEVGTGLISLFETLANDRKILPGGDLRGD